MFSITEQFSAATKSQLEAQLNLLNSFASKAVDSAQKVLALNISTTKASVEKSSAAARQLLEAKDPQEFFSVSGKAPNLDGLLAYSRELFSIASAAQAELIQSAKEQIKEAAPAAKAVTAKLAAPAEVSKAATPPVVAVATASANEQVATPAAPKAAVKTEAKAKPAAATPVADAVAQLVEPALAAKPAAAPVEAPAPKAAAVKPAAKPSAKPAAVSFPTAKSVSLKSVTPPAKTAPGKLQQAKQLDMLGGGKAKK